MRGDKKPTSSAEDRAASTKVPSWNPQNVGLFNILGGPSMPPFHFGLLIIEVLRERKTGAADQISKTSCSMKLEFSMRLPALVVSTGPLGLQTIRVASS